MYSMVITEMHNASVLIYTAVLYLFLLPFNSFKWTMTNFVQTDHNTTFLIIPSHFSEFSD